MKSILLGLFIVGLTALVVYICANLTSPKYLPHNRTTKAKTVPPIKHDYTITYGNKNAPHTLISFFDIGCTHCATFFREKFPQIKKVWVESEQLSVVFKPYPIHQETLFFMSCCEGLTDMQKLILFETLMETQNPNADSIYAAMEVLKRPFRVPTSSALKEALLLTTKHQFEALPVLFFDDWPLSDDDQDNLTRFLQEISR